MTKQHTPGPWLVHEWGNGCLIVEARIGATQKPGFIGMGQRVLARGLPRPNAEFIVQACNAHKELLAALEILADPTAWLKQGNMYAIPVKASLLAQAAIDKAMMPACRLDADG